MPLPPMILTATSGWPVRAGGWNGRCNGRFRMSGNCSSFRGRPLLPEPRHRSRFCHWARPAVMSKVFAIPTDAAVAARPNRNVPRDGIEFGLLRWPRRPGRRFRSRMPPPLAATGRCIAARHADGVFERQRPQRAVGIVDGLAAGVRCSPHPPDSVVKSRSNAAWPLASSVLLGKFGAMAGDLQILECLRGRSANPRRSNRAIAKERRGPDRAARRFGRAVP